MDLPQLLHITCPFTASLDTDGSFVSGGVVGGVVAGFSTGLSIIASIS